MKLRHPRSIIIVLIYFLGNIAILTVSFTTPEPEIQKKGKAKSLAPDFTIIDDLDYFSLKNGVPSMSLSADSMVSRNEDYAEFKRPKGIYDYVEKNESIKYQGLEGTFVKAQDLLSLKGEVRLTSTESEYEADKVDYFMEKDLVIGNGNVIFEGQDLRSGDRVKVAAPHMVAQPNAKTAQFTGGVKGSMVRKKKYEGKMDFVSQSLNLDGVASLAHLEGDVWLKRSGHVITAGKADIYLENYNKSLKYFVLNDDVKVTEKVSTPKGVTERKAYSERLEGFGREQKMVLSGAPRVEQGTDVIKGYRITIRENVDLIEVDDAMSDMKVKRDEKAN